MSKNAKDKSQTVSRIPSACADEYAAVQFLEAERWGDTPECAHCGSQDVYKMKSRDGSRNKRCLWRCRECGQQYTVRIGTIFEDSRIPLQHWCYAFWRACSFKKGVSALEIKRQTGLSYKSALFMMHRIRYAMCDDGASPEPMKGDVEVDETYVGGKPRRPWEPREKWPEKTPVAAIVERDGRVRASVMPEVTAKNLKTMIRENVHPGANVYTDEASLVSRSKARRRFP